MEEPNEPQKTLPKVLILKPPTVFRLMESHFNKHFNFIKAYSSPLSLPEFLAAENATDISAVLATALGPQISAKDVLDHLPSLRCIVTASAGVDHIDIAECHRRCITVANAADVFADDCAETAVGLLISVFRKVSAGDGFVRGGKWSSMEEFSLGYRLRGKRIGIVGYGSIGSKVAKRLEAFGCIISYNSRKKKPSISYPFYSNVLELADSNDALIICCSLTDQTKHMINKEVLSVLGKKGVIINVARGAIIDEKELVRCLVQGKIAGAGLDVFEDEPNVPKELFGMDNVVLSPHQAVFTQEAFIDMYELLKENLLAFFSNKPLLSPFCL